MKRMTEFIAGSLLLFGAVAFAQDATPSQIPEDAFSSRQLIAWSGLQKPQPAPQPIPPRDTPVPQPDQPQDQQANPPANPRNEETPTRSFTGKIVEDSGKYALKVGSEMYALEQQDGLAKYKDETVRVVGQLDPANHTIHVLKIDLLS